MNDNPLRITYVLDEGTTTVEVGERETILYAAEERGIDLPCGCHQGHCGACAVEILEGIENLREPGIGEEYTLSRIEAPENVRLSCQNTISGPVTVKPYDPFA